jgi:rhodanese-related sulfurtransferase
VGVYVLIMRKAFLILIVLPILIGGIVLLVAGRPIAYEVLQRRTARRFPAVSWIRTGELASWQEDSLRMQPVLLDARTQAEFEVSHLKGAVQIDPYKPTLRSLAGFLRDTPIVVYSSAGYRGAGVAAWLGRSGYRNAQNLGSSLFQWVNEGRPLFRGDRPTAVVHPYDRKWAWLLGRDYRAKAPDVERRSAAP